MHAIRKLRLAHDYTLEELAHRAEVSSSTVFKIETGRTRPRRSTLHVLAEALGVTPQDLLNGIGPDSPSGPIDTTAAIPGSGSEPTSP